MEAIRKQASKLREQVSKQQQAVLKQFSGRFCQDYSVSDEVELQCHQKLQMLNNSTREAKHLQRDIVRGVEGFISSSSKQMEILVKLAEDCCKYGNKHESSEFALGKASTKFGASHHLMEKEQENMLSILGDQVSEPLRSEIIGAPLEDARHLAYRYERIRQDVEAQKADVRKRQARAKENGPAIDSALKLQNAESRLSELGDALSALGREATTAMVSVGVQQQIITLQKLLTMVDSERCYHHNVAAILDKLHDEIVMMKPNGLSVSLSTTTSTNPSVPPTTNEDTKLIHRVNAPTNGQGTPYFIAEVIHSFDAQSDGELCLEIGDYVVVRQVASTGWSEGECRGKAGWFPSAYIEQRDKAPASKVMETRLLASSPSTISV